MSHKHGRKPRLLAKIGALQFLTGRWTPGHLPCRQIAGEAGATRYAYSAPPQLNSSLISADPVQEV